MCFFEVIILIPKANKIKLKISIIVKLSFKKIIEIRKAKKGYELNKTEDLETPILLNEIINKIKLKPYESVPTKKTK